MWSCPGPQVIQSYKEMGFPSMTPMPGLKTQHILPRRTTTTIGLLFLPQEGLGLWQVRQEIQVCPSTVILWKVESRLFNVFAATDGQVTGRLLGTGGRWVSLLWWVVRQVHRLTFCWLFSCDSFTYSLPISTLVCSAGLLVSTEVTPVNQVD